MGHPAGHRDEIPSNVSGQDVQLASRHPNRTPLESPIPNARMRQDAGKSRSMKKSEPPCPTGLKTLVNRLSSTQQKGNEAKNEE